VQGPLSSLAPANASDSPTVGAAQAVQWRPVVQQGEVPMSPFIAAFVACSSMLAFIVFFGILLPGHGASEPDHT
jgi:hypothetical protein